MHFFGQVYLKRIQNRIYLYLTESILGAPYLKFLVYESGISSNAWDSEPIYGISRQVFAKGILSGMWRRQLWQLILLLDTP